MPNLRVCERVLQADVCFERDVREVEPERGLFEVERVGDRRGVVWVGRDGGGLEEGDGG